MAGKSASLLTKTQRNRIRDDFDDLDEEKKRRDQQRIRERVRSGLLDFQLLADYPDRQFEIAFDELSDDELRTALASTTIVVERLCELNGIDREELIQEVRAQTEDGPDTTDAASIDQIELQTSTEIRRQIEAEIEEELGDGPWDKRASRLGKLAATFFVSLTILLIYAMYIADVAARNFSLLIRSLWFFFVICTSGWLLIRTLQTLKYDIIPVLAKFRRNPIAIAMTGIRNIIKDPGEKMQEIWRNL